MHNYKQHFLQIHQNVSTAKRLFYQFAQLRHYKFSRLEQFNKPESTTIIGNTFQPNSFYQQQTIDSNQQVQYNQMLPTTLSAVVTTTNPTPN